MNLQLNWESTHKALECKFMLHMGHTTDSQRFSRKHKRITNPLPSVSMYDMSQIQSTWQIDFSQRLLPS